jgi:hypothetical protein
MMPRASDLFSALATLSGLVEALLVDFSLSVFFELLATIHAFLSFATRR